MSCVFDLFPSNALLLNSRKPFHTQIWAAGDSSRLLYRYNRYHRQHVPSFPGQQNRMAIGTCHFCVSGNEHQSSHEDRASSCLHIKSSSLGSILFRHLNILIIFYQNANNTLGMVPGFHVFSKIYIYASHGMLSASQLRSRIQPPVWAFQLKKKSMCNATENVYSKRVEHATMSRTYSRKIHQNEVMVISSVSKRTWRRVMRSWLELLLQSGSLVLPKRSTKLLDDASGIYWEER